MTKINLPFSWLARYMNWLTVGSLVAVAALFRFFDLVSLPPGLATPEAKVGLEVLKLTNHGWMPGFSVDSGFAPLWVWIQSLSVKVIGHTALSLRFWPALLGVAAVYVTWVLLKDWFGRRTAWIAAFLLAVTPWAVTISRNATVEALILLLAPLTFWATLRAYRHGKTVNWIMASVILVLDLFAGPFGWLLALVVAALTLFALWQGKDLKRPSRDLLIAAGVLVSGLVLFGFTMFMSIPALRDLPGYLGLSTSVGSILDSSIRTLLMFNMRGDENFWHNFAAQPLLNAFVGLMFVAGVLVSISRIQRRLYQVALGLLVVFLLPAALCTVGAPNAAFGVLTLPVVMTLAAVGISYMLELWYATFPINSAARATGQSVIIVLLLLSVFQGYAQYFRAWSGSIETYTAYNESSVEATKFMNKSKFTGTRFFVGTGDELPVATYLAADSTKYRAITPKQIADLPITPGTRQFIITANARDDAAKNLVVKFPGGKLRPQLSSFSQNEIYYVYEAAK